MSAARDAMIASLLPPALELMTAFTQSKDDPAFYWQAMQRVIGDAMSTDDPARGMAEVVFGLSALSGILLDQLSDTTGSEQSDLLAAVHRAYLLPAKTPDNQD